MYKKVNNIQIVNDINSTTHDLFPELSGYCDIIKHPINSEWLIPLNRRDILDVVGAEIIPEYDVWVITDVIETIPEDYFWYMLEKNFRIIANNTILNHILVNDDLGALFIALRADHVEQTFIDNTNGTVYIYVSYIDPLYEPILLAYPDTITIEQKQ